ncbi:MAG: hypothetical protein WC755_09650 [Candidatus Woesearchaeota archaeon]|jgi:hypothetical protein
MKNIENKTTCKELIKQEAKFWVPLAIAAAAVAGIAYSSLYLRNQCYEKTGNVGCIERYDSKK